VKKAAVKRVTDKDNTSEFSIEKLKEVTDKQNQVKIAIPSQVFTYRSYYGMPNLIEGDEENEDFSAIVAALAYLMDVDLIHLMRGAYERYWAMLMGEDYQKVLNDPAKVFKQAFKIIQGTEIAAKLYKDSILHVYDDGRLLVIVDGKLARKVQEIRGLDEK
jgi:hypothetical protein